MSSWNYFGNKFNKYKTTLKEYKKTQDDQDDQDDQDKQDLKDLKFKIRCTSNASGVFKCRKQYTSFQNQNCVNNNKCLDDQQYNDIIQENLSIKGGKSKRKSNKNRKSKRKNNKNRKSKRKMKYIK